MTEAFAFAPGILDGIIPQAPALPISELPFHLWRRTLMQIRREKGKVPEKLWNERGEAVEVRTQGIIASQTEIVDSVTKNPPYTEGSDLTVKLVDGLVVKVEVKSSHLGIRDRKHQIRNRLPFEENNGQLIGPWIKELAISEWLTENKIILINGGEEDYKEKTPEEILNDSFYPQLERIQRMVKIEQAAEKSVQTKLFPDTKLIQIFPQE